LICSDPTPPAERIARHIAAIRAIDGRGHLEGLRLARQAAALKRQFEHANFAPAEKAVTQIKRAIRRRLDPHHVDFPKHDHGYAVSGIDGSVRLSLSFEVWPRLPGANLYATHIRAPIKVNSMGARDAAEFDHICTGLKDAADRLALVHYTSSGDRANG
jgi:hypothetical protein